MASEGVGCGFGLRFVRCGGSREFASDELVELELGWLWWLVVPPLPFLLPRLQFVLETDVEFRGEENLRNSAIVGSEPRVRWLVMWQVELRAYPFNSLPACVFMDLAWRFRSRNDLVGGDVYGETGRAWCDFGTCKMAPGPFLLSRCVA